MDRQQILLAKSLEAAEIPLRLKTFDDRLILQKSVYLLQSAGIHIGYRFRWYLRGPYSSDVCADAFGIVNEGEFGQQVLSGWQLDPQSAQQAQKIASLLYQKGESRPAQAKRLELLASTLFLFKTEQAKPNDPESTSKILKQNDKDFSAEDVRIAVKDLKAYGLFA